MFFYRDQDDAIIRPLPRVKRLLSEPTCLAHIIQLLLTFDPILVEKVATLLCEVMKDNPEMSKVYLTGIFYFILMYTGSNVLPIARFLKLTHMKQAFKADEVNEFHFKSRKGFVKIVLFMLVCNNRHHAKKYFGTITTRSNGLLLRKSRWGEICSDIFRRIRHA